MLKITHLCGNIFKISHSSLCFGDSSPDTTPKMEKWIYETPEFCNKIRFSRA